MPAKGGKKGRKINRNLKKCQKYVTLELVRKIKPERQCGKNA